MKRLICGDNLDVLKSDAIDTASVDCVYLDPPFNSKSVYNLPFQKLGKDVAAVEAFTDIWRWDDETRQLQAELKDNPKTFGLWNYVQHVKIVRRGEDSLSAYLVNMAIRLNELPRVMKSSATLWLHCDPTASHYLKILLDGLFGSNQFQNEIIWKRTTAHSDALSLGNSHDTILLYSKGDKFKWNKQYSAYDEKYEVRFRSHDPDGRRWMDDNLTAKGLSGGGYDYEYKGCKSYWRLPLKSMEQLDREGRLHFTKNGGIRLKRYLDESKGLALQDVWTDISPINSQAQERLGYPTQKPVALLERIVGLASDENDTVLDPFCGCGTALHAAETIHRNWIGIDISRFSVGVVKSRLVESFETGILSQITVSGIPTDIESARALAQADPWEFEKWVCGQLGAKGLYKRPGAKGADAGIDGVVEFFADPKNKSYAIVQVKGGAVKPNDVKALYSDVDTEPMARAGVFVCFAKFKATAQHAASSKTFKDKIAGNEWPVIKILTVEDVLANKMPKLPNQVIQQGFRTHRVRQTELDL